MKKTMNMKQRGAVLAVSLVILLLLAFLSVAGMRTSVLEEKMSNSMQDSQIGFQAAEAALRDAEGWLFSLTAAPTPVASCASQPCVRILNSNFYLEDQTAAWWTANAAEITGDDLSLVASQPRYIIEYVNFVPDAAVTIGQGVPSGKYYYRITARSVGTSSSAITMLRTTYARRY